MKRKDDNAALRAYVLKLSAHVAGNEPISDDQRWVIAALLKALAKQIPTKSLPGRGKLNPLDVGLEFALLRRRNISVSQAYKQLAEKYDVEPEAIGKCVRQQPAAQEAIAFVETKR